MALFYSDIDAAYYVGIIEQEHSKIERLKEQISISVKQKMEYEETLRMLQFDIDAQVYEQYPPKKGSETDRKKLREKLQREDPVYAEHATKLKEIVFRINQLNDEIDVVDRQAKNARRILEVYNKQVDLFVHQNQNQGLITAANQHTGTAKNAGMF